MTRALSDICLKADHNLFRKVLDNLVHVLHQLLPHFLPLPTVIPLELVLTIANFLVVCLI